MNHDNKNSQAANNNGTLGREVEEEHTNRNPNSVENETPTTDGFAENERHWPHIESDITAEEAEEGAKNYPGEVNSEGQISHAENNGGTSEEDL